MRPWSRSGMSVVTGLLLVWTSLGIDAHESAVTIMSSQATRHQRGRPVGKSVVSSKLRLVFFAGLEGTGHHYVSNVFTKLYDTYPDVEAIVSCHIGTNVFLPRTMSENALHYQESQDNLRSALQELAVLEENLSPEGTIVTVQKTSRLQKKCHVGIGQLSFPNLHGPDKALSYPDLQLLARIAEEEGIDFRVLYLQRSAEEILLSDTAHRRFHDYLRGYKVEDHSPEEAKFMEYIRIIMTDASALHSTLAELGCGFIICHSYDMLGDEEQARRIAEFLSPSDTVAQYLTSSFLDGVDVSATGKNESLEYMSVQVVLDRFQNKLDVMALQLCDPGCK